MADRVSFVVGLVALLVAALVLLGVYGSLDVDPWVVAGVLVAAVGAAGLLLSLVSLRRRGPG